MDRLSSPPPRAPPAAADAAGPRVWVTRAEPGAARTATRLRALGYAPLVAPLIETRPLPFAAPDAAAYDLLAFTSAAGVTAFAGAVAAPLDTPVFTVGDATAEAARAVGFSTVRSAHGDGPALCALILADAPDRTRVLHPTALRPAFDLAAALRQEGRDAQSLAVYETQAVAALPPAARHALDEGAPHERALGAILIHSPAAGRALAALHAALPADVALVALSANCAQPVQDLGARIVVAAAPHEAALLEALDTLRLHTAPAPGADALGKPAPRR